MTNAVVEEFNNKMRTIARKAYGFRFVIGADQHDVPLH
jgi:transposase